MREVLRAIASFSGVELPGLPPGLQNDGAPLPRLDIKTLKDRFRNDLEGFSIKTTEELSKQAKERTRAALDAIQSEVGGRIEQVAGELREQLQLPAQVEKLLESGVGKAAVKLESSLTQKVEQLFAEQERMAQERLQQAPSPVHVETGTVEESEARLERSLSLRVEQLFAEQERLAQERLQGALNSVQTQTSSLAEVQARLESSLTQKVEQLFAEQERMAQERFQGALNSVQTQTSSLGEVQARLESSLTQKVEQLLAERERLVQDRVRGVLSSVQVQISALETAVRQIRDLKAASVTQLSADRPNTATDNATKRYESSPNNELNGFLDQAFSRIKGSFNNFLEIPKMESGQRTAAGLEEQRKVIPFNNTTMQSRVEQALEQLGRLGTKNPHPASSVEGLKAAP